MSDGQISKDRGKVMSKPKDPIEYMCKHYSPMHDNEKCNAGILYWFPFLKPINYPCFGKNTGRCEKFENYSEDEIRKDQEEVAKILRMVGEGISPCCNAPLDKSQVIVGGQYDGHGPQFCSKCKKFVCRV